MELGGTLHIQRANTERMDVIHFGCELKGLQRNKLNDGATRKFPQLKERKRAPIDNAYPFALLQPLRALRRPTCNLKLAAEKRNIKLAGWFHAHQLPVEKFISPFIFRNNSLQMSGVAELKGTFDDQSILIKYDADDLKIENENLCIAIPSLHSPMPGQLVGTHRIDLSDYTYDGNLPIHSASYFEKNTGVEFKDIQATASFKNGFIRLSPIEAYCEGIYLAGDLDLDLSDPLPGVFDLTVQCPTLFGKVFQVRQLLSRIDPASLLRKIPLEGEVNCREKGLKLKFAFFPLDWRFEADFSGKITDGSIALEEADMALRGIYLDLDYNHGSQLLKFSDIQGTLLVGKPRRVEEYLLSGHHIHFDQITEKEPSLDFDVAVKDSHHELFRAAGFTKRDLEGFTGIHLDQKLSHISCITPDDWHCKLKDWSSVEMLKFSSKFDIGKFLQDLQRFRRTGLLFLSHGVIERIAQFLPVEGDAYLELDLRPDQMYSFHCQGSGIKQGGSKEISAVLKGCKQGKKWLVDQLSWDDWSLSFELHQAPEKWRIPFLGLKVGSDVLLGLDGDWYEEEGLLLAKLNFCEVDCSLLERFAITQPFAASWSPKGTLKATGNVEWNIFSQNPWEGCKISLSAKAEGLTLRGFPFEVGNVFQLSLLPARPWVLENVQIIINPESYFLIKQLEYPSAYSNGHQTLNAEFQIPSHHLKMLGDSLYHHFSDIADFSAKDMLAEAKREGCLKGNLFVESFPSNQSSIRIELEDGLYAFKKREYDLKGPQIFISSNGLEFSAFTHHERFPFQIRGKMHWPGCSKGEVMLFGQGALKPLAIAWSSSPSGKPFFQSIAGEFCGCKVFLKGLQDSAENRGWQALEGEINVDIHRLCPLLTPALSEGIKKLKIGSTYCLKGNFWFDPERGKSLLEASSFRGTLSSENPIFKGYQMQSLQAEMQFVPGRLDVQNFSIQDPAGCFKVPHCIVLQGSQSEKWTFFSPSFSVKNLKPSQLTAADVSQTHSHSYSKFRSMMLKKIEFQDARGDLDDVRTWKAEGNLHFLNPSRKNVFHPLFAIPAEIILRLGLNPHVLNPVSGMIFFTLKGDRFYLTRFKDVYSEGRGSKFNLAEGPGPSWVDFNGDLSVNIRMKQYNLIFKIAELFTVSIHGNIKKPRYSLQKQTKSPRKSQLLNISNSDS